MTRAAEGELIYLNHAGTSWPKPAPVRAAVHAAMERSPLAWAEDFELFHRAVAGAFGLDDPARLLLTPGCTSALEIAIADQAWEAGERVITSAWEHQALVRPVLGLLARGVEHVVIPPAGEAPVDLDRLEGELARGGVRLVAMTAAANVSGALLPVEAIAALCRRHGARYCVDAAQLAGWVELELPSFAGGVDLLTFAGHKGPQAPWGIGGLYVREGLNMAARRTRPGGPRFDAQPGYCDVGSVDRLALAGLAAGLEWLAAPAHADRLERARAVMAALRERLSTLAGVEFLGPVAAQARLATLALRVTGRPASALAAELRAHGIVASGGLQCAAAAHQTLGTYPEGALRLSAGPQTTMALVDPVHAAFEALLETSRVALARGRGACESRGVSEQETLERFYPIGSPGQPWTAADRRAWRDGQSLRRSYAQEVRAQLDALDASVRIEQYGALSVDPERYPLFAVLPAAPRAELPWALVTGGVHGYETSGVQGALAFLRTKASAYLGRVNLLVAPCVSPWAYEIINRWNPEAIDPNRSFVRDSPAQECAALMRLVAKLEVDFLAHMDLHETTDSDESEFRPALAAREGEAFEPGHIPDGFYTVGDSENPQPGFQAAIIAGVEAVTHIAEADAAGEIIGATVTQRGVINYPCAKLGLCASLTNARFTTTTEVYPDSPRATAEICNAAQVAAVCAGLDYALAST